MTNNWIAREASMLIDEFLMNHEHPNPAEWKALIDSHPEFASDIADAALIHGSEDLEVKSEPINEALFAAKVSSLINRAHQLSDDILEVTEQKVESIKGPATRKMAVDIGIGDYPSLLNGILVGRIQAPTKILQALSERLSVSVAALAELFHRSFAIRTVPSYKALNGQPTVNVEPLSWEAAVSKLEADTKEINRLLAYADED